MEIAKQSIEPSCYALGSSDLHDSLIDVSISGEKMMMNSRHEIIIYKAWVRKVHGKTPLIKIGDRLHHPFCRILYCFHIFVTMAYTT